MIEKIKLTHQRQKEIAITGLWGAVMIAIFFSAQVHAEIVDRIVAIVNDDIITLQELNEAIAPYEKEVLSQGLSVARQRQTLTKLRRDVLNSLINEKLKNQQIGEHKISVSDKAIDDYIEQIKARQYFTDEQLREELQKKGFTLDSYKEHLREQMLQARLLNLEIKSKVVVTEADIRAAYEAQQSKYGGKKEYHLQNILMKPQSETESAQRQALDRMQEVLDRFKSGTPFDELARRYSQSPLAQSGGDLGLFSLKDLAPQIRQAVESLKAGQATPVLDTDMGLQIFHVKEIVESPGVPYEKVRDEIEKELYEKTLEKKFQNWMSELRKSANIEILN